MGGSDHVVGGHDGPAAPRAAVEEDEGHPGELVLLRLHAADDFDAPQV